jgi:hypothetical protein
MQRSWRPHRPARSRLRAAKRSLDRGRWRMPHARGRPRPSRSTDEASSGPAICRGFGHRFNHRIACFRGRRFRRQRWYRICGQMSLAPPPRQPPDRPAAPPPRQPSGRPTAPPPRQPPRRHRTPWQASIVRAAACPGKKPGRGSAMARPASATTCFIAMP